MLGNLAQEGHGVLCFDASGTQERAHLKAKCAGFRVEQLAKDLDLHEEALSASGSPNPISPSILSVWRQLKGDDADGDITLAYPFIRDGKVKV